MNKGNGKNPVGVRWLMASGAWLLTYWATHEFYTREEVSCWECSTPVRPLFPLDVML